MRAASVMTSSNPLSPDREGGVADKFQMPREGPQQPIEAGSSGDPSLTVGALKARIEVLVRC